MPQEKIIHKKKTLRYSFADGVFASLMGGFVQNYFTPFLLAVGGTVGQAGILGAIPNLFASLTQLKSPAMVEKFSARKPIMDLFVPLQAVSLLFMAMLALLDRSGPLVFISAVVLFTSFGALAAPAWSSMMSEIVDKEKWGRYFGWRSQVLGIITIIAALTASMVLHFTKKTCLFTGFSILFGAAFIFRIISWRFLRLMEEPALKKAPPAEGPFPGKFSGSGAGNFSRFVFFAGAVNFSAGLAGPFFSVLMLEGLHFTYLTYIALSSTQALATYLSIKRWGRHADRLGNIKIISSTSKLIVFIPALWLASRNPFYLIFVQVFSGFVWAGFNLSTSNFVFDASSPAGRTRSIAYLNAASGIGLCLGALMGGLLIPLLPPLFGQKILSLFVISSIIGLPVAFLVPFGLREVRWVQKISFIRLLSSVAGVTSLHGKQEPDSI